MLNPDQELSKKIETYQQVGKENPNVDVSMLMMNALNNQAQNSVSSKAKKWAYLISISLPPIGLLWAVKYYYFSDEEDAKQVGIVCAILTVVAVIIFWASAKLFFNTAGVSPSQIEQIKPSDIQQILQ